MKVPSLKDTHRLVLDALTVPAEATAERTARLLAMLIDTLEQKELLDRSEIDEFVIKLG